MPTDEWLFKKLDKLNMTLVEGYPSRTSEARGLEMDLFIRPARSQSKSYGLHINNEKSSSSVSFCVLKDEPPEDFSRD